MATTAPVRYVISPERATDPLQLWTCSCGTHRVNFAWLRCARCGDKSPARQARDDTRAA